MTRTGRHISAWQNAVVYQIYPRSFKEVRRRVDGYRGEGSILGIIDRLDYLAGLGVDVLWLSPCYPSPMIDGGYDVSDYCDIDPRYGTLADFDELVAEARARDMQIMLDFVPNHTSSQHPWFLEARSDPASPRRDWYIWRDPAPGGGLPNNWASVFSGSQLEKRRRGQLVLPDGVNTPPVSAWTYDEASGQYYLHSFAAEQPDLNWAHPPVQQAMTDVLRYWLDRGVDGFRVDAVNYIGKDPAFRDEAANSRYREGVDNPYDQLHRRHSCDYPATMLGLMRLLCNVLDEPAYAHRDTHMVFEAYTTPRLVAAINRLSPKVSAFNFSRFGMEWRAAQQRQAIETYYRHLPEQAIANNVNGNHDSQRLASRIGERQARAAALLNAALPGVMYIYQGEEAGFSQAEVSFSARQDLLGSRDGERTPMLWDDTPGAGFSVAAADRFWLPIDRAQGTSIARQNGDNDSSVELYRQLLAVRRHSAALRRGRLEWLPAGRGVMVFSRTAGDERALVVMSFSAVSREVSVAAQYAPGSSPLTFRLEPYQAVLMTPDVRVVT